MRFAHPWYLSLLIPTLPLFLFFRSSGASIQFSSLSQIRFLKDIRQLGASSFSWQHYLPILLRLATVILIIIALARPQSGRKQTEVTSEGVDIILTLDTSGSMEGLDFKIEGKPATRLDVVKDVVSQFILKRPGDRLGMVIFGDEAFTQAPLTLDHDLLLALLKGVTIGMAGQKTAIGSALGVSVNRLKDLKAKSKVVILLTDGSSNAGALSPIKAAEVAAALGVKIYTIGIGSDGPVPFLVGTLFGKRTVYEQADLDEETLRKISEMTGARYFRAKDTERLQEIYGEIDRLEKSEARVKEYMEYDERFMWFLIPGIILLILEIILTQTRLRKIP